MFDVYVASHHTIIIVQTDKMDSFDETEDL